MRGWVKLLRRTNCKASVEPARRHAGAEPQRKEVCRLPMPHAFAGHAPDRTRVRQSPRVAPGHKHESGFVKESRLLANWGVGGGECALAGPVVWRGSPELRGELMGLE